MKFGCRCVGEKRLLDKLESIQFHWADRNNRTYLCGCVGAYRVGKEIKYAFGKRHKQSKMQFERGLNTK